MRTVPPDLNAPDLLPDIMEMMFPEEWSPIPMTTQATKVLEAALALTESERAAVAEELIASLQRTHSRLDALWAMEAEDRLRAYKEGEIEAIPAEEVFKELRKS